MSDTNAKDVKKVGSDIGELVFNEVAVAGQEVRREVEQRQSQLSDSEKALRKNVTHKLIMDNEQYDCEIIPNVCLRYGIFLSDLADMLSIGRQTMTSWRADKTAPKPAFFTLLQLMAGTHPDFKLVERASGSEIDELSYSKTNVKVGKIEQ